MHIDLLATIVKQHECPTCSCTLSLKEVWELDTESVLGPSRGLWELNF